jgi:hypothetical protein
MLQIENPCVKLHKQSHSGSSPTESYLCHFPTLVHNLVRLEHSISFFFCFFFAPKLRALPLSVSLFSPFLVGLSDQVGVAFLQWPLPYVVHYGGCCMGIRLSSFVYPKCDEFIYYVDLASNDYLIGSKLQWGCHNHLLLGLRA